MSSSPPARFQPSDSLRRREGATLDRLTPALVRSDPLADTATLALATLPARTGFELLERGLTRGVDAIPDAPEALRALVAHGETVPAWVDHDASDRGGAAILRAGLAGGLVLGMKSLVLGYASPGGNKPLVLSGRMHEQAPRRLAETSRFVQAVSRPGGLRPRAEGHVITVKVRMMHAQVRRLALHSGRWREELWGAPINQHDMLATILLFSVAVVEGLRTLGYDLSAAEGEDVVHLWRHVGHLIGVEPALLPTRYADALATAEVIRDTQGPPDDDARSLVRALFDARLAAARSPAERRVAALRAEVMYGLCRVLVGDRLADALAIPHTPLRHVGPLLRPALGLAARAGRLPLGRTLAVHLGDRYWDLAIADGLGREPARFSPPAALTGAARNLARPA